MCADVITQQCARSTLIVKSTHTIVYWRRCSFYKVKRQSLEKREKKRFVL